MPRSSHLLALAMVCVASTALTAQDPLPAALPPPPAAPADGTRFPINLPTALQLARARPIDVALAGQRLEAAWAQHQKAKWLWLPTISAGFDYARHDGQLQDVVGNVFGDSKQSMMFGTGVGATFSISEAYHGPLAARQLVQSREADVQAAVNDSFLAVAEAYFTVQQARGEVAGALLAAARADEVVRRVTELAPGLTPLLEVNRARTEQARRKQALIAAQERWRTAGADLARLLRLPPGSVVDPVEPPQLDINLIDANQSIDDLIPLALTNRPELAARQAFVQFTLQRLKQEQQRPLLPSILLRGNATNPAGTLSSGAFGGGVNGNLGNFGMRNSADIQLLWEFQNLGAGNRAAVRERQAENQQAMLELFRTQDRIAAEVVQAQAQARAAAARLTEAAEGLRFARETLDQSLEGMKQTTRIGERNVLVVRPAEVVAAVQGLGQAFADLYAAVADQNRAQARLYRALGQPAQGLDVKVEPKTFTPPAPLPPK